MIASFAFLRALVFLRRISRELKRGNDLHEAALELRYPAWSKAGGVRRKHIKFDGIHAATIDELNDAYREHHPEIEDDNDEIYHDHNIP